MDYNFLLNFKDKNIKNLDYFFIKDGKLVNPNDIINNKHNFTNLECHRRVKGGILGMDEILDSVLAVFDVIVKPIIAIGNVFIFILQFIFFILKFALWFVKFIIWILIDLFNPVNFVNDFFNSLMLILYAIYNTIFNIIFAMASLMVNSIGGWFQGFWGWDMSGLTKKDKNSPYFRSFNKQNGQKSYVTNSNTVPFSIIFGTILCPPMGVFMDLGVTGWLNILICAILTLLFYLPGLCYALLIIYS